MTDDDPARWTDDEIDVLVRDTVGEIGPDRFEELLQHAMVVAEQPEEPPTRTRSRRTGRSALRSTRWLSAAAAVVVVGSVAVLVNRPSRGDGVADEAGPTSTAEGPVAGPTSTQPPTTQPPTCQLESGGGPVTPSDPSTPALSPRVFRCAIVAAVSDDDGTVLVTDDIFTRGAVPAVGVGGSPCIDIRSASPSLVVTVGECSGEGMRAKSVTPGTYAIEFRLATCTDPVVPEGCGPPGSDYVGRIIVEVGL